MGIPIPDNTPLRFNVSQAAVCSTVEWTGNSFFSMPKLVYGVGHPISLGHQPVVLQPLGSSSNLTSTFSKVAESMTNWIRTSAGVPQPGVMQQWVIHSEVR
jgi:hypothetical protein